MAVQRGTFVTSAAARAFPEVAELPVAERTGWTGRAGTAEGASGTRALCSFWLTIQKQGDFISWRHVVDMGVGGGEEGLGQRNLGLARVANGREMLGHVCQARLVSKTTGHRWHLQEAPLGGFTERFSGTVSFTRGGAEFRFRETGPAPGLWGPGVKSGAQAHVLCLPRPSSWCSGCAVLRDVVLG